MAEISPPEFAHGINVRLLDFHQAHHKGHIEERVWEAGADLGVLGCVSVQDKVVDSQPDPIISEERRG